MVKSKNILLVEKIIPAYALFILVTILFLPPISIKSNFPAIEIVDFLMPVSLVLLFLKREALHQKILLFLLALFALFIFITIAVNSRFSVMSDYFEIYKIIKFAVLILLFSLIRAELFLTKWIPIFFLFLVVFNLVQYFNIFNFNAFLEVYYFGNTNYTDYGLSSAGFPNSKRMMGFTANPNNNAVIFSIFAILFLPKKQEETKKWIIFFSLAILMTFLCQSRTAMMALPCILIVYGFIYRKQIKRTLLVTGISICCAALSYLITIVSIGVGTPANIAKIRQFEKDHPNVIWHEDTQEMTTLDGKKNDYTYLESVVHGEFVEGSSMKGRYEIWQHLFSMIKEKPLLGHGPNKAYFYENKLYAENEFIFAVWKYGFIGLILLFLPFLHLLKKAWKNLSLISSQNFLLIIVLYVVISMTNLPFSAITLNMLLAIFAGTLLSEIASSKKNNE